jgi:hypothetical protein
MVHSFEYQIIQGLVFGIQLSGFRLPGTYKLLAAGGQSFPVVAPSNWKYFLFDATFAFPYPFSENDLRRFFFDSLIVDW